MVQFCDWILFGSAIDHWDDPVAFKCLSRVYLKVKLAESKVGFVSRVATGLH